MKTKQEIVKSVTNILKTLSADEHETFDSYIQAALYQAYLMGREEVKLNP